jgi:hypothetical protein
VARSSWLLEVRHGEMDVVGGVTMSALKLVCNLRPSDL